MTQVGQSHLHLLHLEHSDTGRPVPPAPSMPQFLNLKLAKNCLRSAKPLIRLISTKKLTINNISFFINFLLSFKIKIFQGCGLRSFPIGGMLDAPTQVTGTPVSSAVVQNSVFVSSVKRWADLNPF